MSMKSIAIVFAVAFMAACAHAQEPPRKDPDGRQNPPPPPFGEDPDQRRARAEQIEKEIQDLGIALKREGDQGKRELIQQRINLLRSDLKMLHWQQDESRAMREKAAALEREIHETERMLESKDLGEKRPAVEERLRTMRARLGEMREAMKRMGPGEHHGDPLRIKGPPPHPQDPELMKIQRQAAELERASMDLSHKLRSIPADNKDERSSILDKLKATVTELFDVKEKARAREVEMLKKRLEELTQMLEKRKSNRDAIIEKRVKQLSGESDELDW
jgi:hypothetical protein